MNLGLLAERRPLDDPPFLRLLFANAVSAPLWLLARLYLGWQWLGSGWGKIEGDGWVNRDGSSLQAFWQRIVQVPESGRAPIQYDWYRDFIQYMLDREWYTWFAWLIAYGEVFVGLALIVGAFTALAALGGAFLNFNFMLGGTAGTNPVLFLLAILLVLAWKVAGYIGLDRWLLPALGTPWSPGGLVRPSARQQPTALRPDEGAPSIEEERRAG